MAKVQSDVVSGMGPNSNRTDLRRVAKINAAAKIENAAGGPYRSRKELTELAQGAPTGATGSANTQQIQQPQIKPIDMFRPGTGILTDGAGFNTEGEPPSEADAALTSPDPGYVLAAALFKAYPNPQTRMNLEAYQQDGIFY